VTRHRSRARRVLDDPILTGIVTLLVLAFAVYLSYTATNGLPFTPTYRLSVDVPDAAELVKHADVRIGGTRVGQVLAIHAMPASGAQPPYARLSVALTRSVKPLPRDTVSQVRLGSVLGGKYLQLEPGHSSSGIADGGVLALGQSRTTVDLDQAFRIFDRPTTAGIQHAVGGLGDAVAGRGAALNDTLVATRALLAPLERVLRVLVAPRTHLAGFLRGTAAASGALAPVADTLASLIDHGATTVAAIDAAGGALGNTIAALPSTEAVATTTLRHARPVLSDAAAIAVALRPGVALLPRAARRLDAVLHTGVPVLRQEPAVARVLRETFLAVESYSRDPASTQSLQVLGTKDLGTFGSLLSGLGQLLVGAAGEQLNCNALGLWVRNLVSATSEGDAAGGWIRMSAVVNSAQTAQSATPSSDLHLNYYPNENAHECEAGNEPYAPGQAIGNPPGNQSTQTEQTSPPPGVRALARRAGLLSHGAGGAR
jgi:phospholipid/cholesterol/gamma-HCH transport system substrate-binding protein